MTNFEFQYELQDVKRSAVALMKRVEQLESIAEKLNPEIATAGENLTNAQPEAAGGPLCANRTYEGPLNGAFASSLASPSISSFRSDSAHGSATDEPEEKAFAPEKTESLEVWLGKNLNKIGISFLVIGCALALVYQFQYFTPLLKILTGIFAGVALIVGGEWFERKPTFNWYGRALIGGGWALAYFSAFAAHHVNSVRVIDSAIADVFLLACIAAGAIKYSLRYKSQSVTAITMTLAFVTLCLTPSTSYTLIACAILIGGTTWLVAKMRWLTLFVYAQSMIYVLSLAVILPQISLENNQLFGLSVRDTNFFCATAFAVFCWAAFNLIIFSVRYTNTSERNRIATAALINAGVFVPTVLALMSPDHLDSQSSFLYATAAAYALSGVSAKQNAMIAILKLHTIMALSLASYAVSFNLHGEALSTFWCLEVPVLVWAGYFFDMAVVRRFAAALAGICAIQVMSTNSYHFDQAAFRYVLDTNLTTGLTALAAACASAAIYVAQALKVARDSNLKPRGGAAFYYYCALAGLASWMVTSTHINENWIALVLTLQCIATLSIGAAIKFSPLRVVGTIGVMFSQLFFLLINTGHWGTLPTVLLIATQYLMSYFYRQASPEDLDHFENGIHNVYALAGTVTLTSLLNQIVAPEWLTVAWTVEGIALLFVGFQIKDKVYRVSGLSLLCFVICRLLLFELSGLETIYRIISFIAAGVVLLIASLAYARLGSRETAESGATEQLNESAA